MGIVNISGKYWRASVVGGRRRWASVVVAAIVGVGGYIGVIGVGGCWRTSAVMGCIGGHIGGVSVYRRHLQESAVLEYIGGSQVIINWRRASWVILVYWRALGVALAAL